MDYKQNNTCVKYLFSILLLLLIYGCQSNGYYFENKRFFEFKHSYSGQDTLLVSDYVFYGINQIDLNNHEVISLNEDSLVGLFKFSIQNLKIPLHFSLSTTNKLNEDFERNPALKYKGMKLKTLLLSNNIKNNQTILLPIINFNFNKSHSAHPAGRDPYPHYVCHLTLAVFIVKDEEVIYYKQMSHAEIVDGEFHPYPYEDFNIPISQEKWDGLVREVMKEYIERVVWGKC
jgi:hypothetical protein